MNVAFHFEARYRKKHSDCLRCELPVKEARLDNLFLVLLTPIPAIKGMFDCAVLPHLATCATQLERPVDDLLAGDNELRASCQLLTKVDFSQSDLLEELETKWHFLTINKIRF